MTVTLASANVVIIAANFNPTIFNQLWLEQKGVVDVADCDPNGTLFTPMAVQVRSPKQGFGFLVLQDRFQFDIYEPEKSMGSLVSEKIGAIVHALPETPFTAVGMNFHWHVENDFASRNAWMRRTFFRAEESLDRHFDTEDARFGGYFSKDLLGQRMKLEVKPVYVADGQGGRKEVIHFGFNFNKDIEGEKKVDQIVESVAHWQEALEEFTNVVNSSTEGLA